MMNSAISFLRKTFSPDYRALLFFQELVEIEKKQELVEIEKKIGLDQSCYRISKKNKNLASHPILNRDSLLRPIDIVLKYKYINALEFLLDQKVNVDAQLGCKNAPIHVATQKADLRALQMLIDAGAKLNDYNEQGKTPLIIATENQNINLIRFLVRQKSVNLDTKSEKMPLENEKSALYIAAEKGNFRILKLLADAGADLDTAGKYGETALMIAIKKGYYKIVHFLLERGVRLDAVYYEKIFTTALHVAAKKGDLRMFKLIANKFISNKYIPASEKSGAKQLTFDIFDGDGNTPFSIAVTNSYDKLIHFMIQNETNSKANSRMVHVAVENNCLYALNLLAKKNVNFDTPNEQNSTPLLLAIGDQKIDVVNFLLKQNVNLSAEFGDKKWTVAHTVAHLAARAGNLNILQALDKRNDINWNAQDNQGRTPLGVVEKYLEEKDYQEFLGDCNHQNVIDFLKKIEKNSQNFPQDNKPKALIFNCLRPTSKYVGKNYAPCSHSTQEIKKISGKK